jgi:hypothetical protein
MSLVNVVTRPTTVLLLMSIAYNIIAVPQERRLEILAMSALTALGVGELMVTLVNVIKRLPVRSWRPTALLSAAGFAGSASYISTHSTILFTTSMLLLVAGIVSARGSGTIPTEPR